MGWKVAPVGTVTVSWVSVAVVTVAWVAPKNTMLLAGVASKLVPVMVTEVPTGPLVGEKEVMVGGGTIVFLNTDTVLPVPFATAKSALPSPSKSPIATDLEFDPVVKSTLVAKLMVPGLVLVFLNTDTVLPT